MQIYELFPDRQNFFEEVRWFFVIFAGVMSQVLHILPLRMTPHSDRTAILNAYSRELGRVAFAVNSGSGAGAARRRALLMALNPVECVAGQRGAGRELLTMREPRAMMPLHVVMGSPERGAVALFMAEVLERVLRQSEADPLLFDFLFDAVGRLNDPAVAPANFHLCFLMRLAVMLGIAPDGGSYRRGMVFDLQDGVFRLSAPLRGRWLSAADSERAAMMLRMNWGNMSGFRFDHGARNRCLDVILDYYSIHLADMSSLKSPQVLKMLFR